MAFAKRIREASLFFSSPLSPLPLLFPLLTGDACFGWSASPFDETSLNMPCLLKGYHLPWVILLPQKQHIASQYLGLKRPQKKFEENIGSGGFGVVYYGKMRDEKEIAIKVLTSNSYQRKREFTNEVTLLSRIHHRNLVQFLGYYQEEGRSILVYEFMHNGTLKEHLYVKALLPS